METKTDIHVELTNSDGNAYSILGATAKALRNGGYPELAEQYLAEAQAGDYDNLLRVTMAFVIVD